MPKARGGLLLTAALLFPALSLADEVSLIPGATIKQAIGGKVRGQVITESTSEVVVQLGGATIRVPVEQITSVKYDGQPASINLGEIREAAGQLSEAAEFYRKAAADAANKPLIVEMVQFREAEVTADLAILDPKYLDDAVAKLQKFLQAHPTGRHVGAARAVLAQLYVHKKDFTSAEREIVALGKLPGAADRAAVLKTSLLNKQGKYDEAVAELDRLIAKFPKNSIDQRSAQLAKAQSLAGLKKFDQAETLVKELILANPPDNAMVQAPAYNTLGDCLREANRPKDALIAYLHTDLLYAKNKEEHPRALYQISQLFRRLKQDGRADEIVQRLKHDYPRSPWLNELTKP